MGLEIALVLVVVSVLSLDHRGAVQGMFSHPLVAGLLTGWIMGDSILGFEIGLVIGMLWSYALPVGGVIPPNGAIVAASAVVVSSLLGGEPWTRAAGLLWGTPFGILGARWEGRARVWNIPFSRKCEQVSVGEMSRALWIAQGVGMVGAVLSQGGALALGLVGGALILPNVGLQAASGLQIGLGGVYPLLVFVGLGAALVGLKIRRPFAWLALIYAGVYALEELI